MYILEEDTIEGSSVQSPQNILTQSYCEQLACQAISEHDIPIECKAYPMVVESLRRRLTENSKKDLAIAFSGMPPGAAYAAMSNVEKGHLHHAQIQRRQTNRNEKGKQW
jgi:hypothetical protein